MTGVTRVHAELGLTGQGVRVGVIGKKKLIYFFLCVVLGEAQNNQGLGRNSRLSAFYTIILIELANNQNMCLIYHTALLPIDTGVDYRVCI